MATENETEKELDEFFEIIHENRIFNKFTSLAQLDGPVQAGHRMGLDFEVIEALVDKGLGSRLEERIVSHGRLVSAALLGNPAHVAKLEERAAEAKRQLDRDRTKREVEAARKMQLRGNTLGDPKASSPRRARWARERMDERRWKRTIPPRNGGPSPKTLKKILDGERVTRNSLEAFITALNTSNLPRFEFSDVPSN